MSELLAQFRDIGRDLFQAHLVTSHGGNMSIRLGNHLIITRRGSMLGRLTEKDLIKVDLSESESKLKLPSSELLVHKEIYNHTDALAVIHAHSPEATVRSLLEDVIVPLDIEGAYLLGKVPVVSTKAPPGSKEVALLLSKALKQHKIVVLRGHGTFAIGQFLEEAFHWTSTLEVSCKILNVMGMLGVEPEELPRS
jgi:L-fuculose-phosphate aldolase